MPVSWAVFWLRLVGGGRAWPAQRRMSPARDAPQPRSTSRHSSRATLNAARVPMALVIAGCAALIVACGSSRMPGASSGQSNSFVPFAERRACLTPHLPPSGHTLGTRRAAASARSSANPSISRNYVSGCPCMTWRISPDLAAKRPVGMIGRICRDFSSRLGWTRRRHVSSAVHGALQSRASPAFAGLLSGRPDLNRGPHRPERCALPGCATPRCGQYPTAIASIRVTRDPV
jgi:hypothetical protein